LNLSDLTNSIKVIVLDSDELSKDTLYYALSTVSAKMDQNEIPVLLFPVTYADSVSMPYEKLYNMWALNMQNTDEYFRYLNRLLRFIKH